MSVEFKRTWTTTLAAALLLTLSLPAHGQLVGRPIGDDPAYWWTLTDQITPEVLRAELQSREKSRERLRAAIEAGLHDEVPEERIAELNYFIDGRLTPELQPMWEALHLWADRFDYYPNWPDDSRTYLVEHGLSPEGVETVMAFSQDYWKVRAGVMQETGPDGGRFAGEILQPAEARMGRRSFRALLKNRDFDRIATMSGKPAVEVKRLYVAWLRDPTAESSIATLREIRGRLSAADWEAFRACMLAVTAPVVQHEGYGEEAFR